MKGRVLLATVTLHGSPPSFAGLTDDRLQQEKRRFQQQLFKLVPALREPRCVKLLLEFKIDGQARLSFTLWLDPQLPRWQALPNVRDPFAAEVEQVRDQLAALQEGLDDLRMRVVAGEPSDAVVATPVFELFLRKSRHAWLVATDASQSLIEMPVRTIEPEEVPRRVTGTVKGLLERRIGLVGVRVDDGIGPTLLLPQLHVAGTGSRYRVGERISVLARLLRDRYTRQCIGATTVGIQPLQSSTNPTTSTVDVRSEDCAAQKQGSVEPVGASEVVASTAEFGQRRSKRQIARRERVDSVPNARPITR